MSILIKGMEMPKSCWDCYFQDCGNCVLNNHKVVDNCIMENQRDADCPLVPVPPHGRLGDLDELKVKIKKEDNGYSWDSYGDGMYDAFQSVYQCIDAAPTIIQAEGGARHD